MIQAFNLHGACKHFVFKTDTLRKKKERSLRSDAPSSLGGIVSQLSKLNLQAKRLGKAGLGHCREINLRVRKTEPMPDEVRLWQENPVLLLLFFFFLLQNNFQLNYQCLEYKRSLLMWNSETDRHREKPPDQRKELLICSFSGNRKVFTRLSHQGCLRNYIK